MSDQVFSRSVRIERPASEVFTWHERPGAFLRLTPPWEKVTLHGEHGGIRDGVRVELGMKLAGWPISWTVEHRDYQAGRSFRDVMLKGPFAKWEHLHLIETAGVDGCILTDRITYRLPLGGPGQFFGGESVRRKLERVFKYRQAVTKADVELAGRHLGSGAKTILLSGASGLVGQNLISFLQTQGHRVLRLVRRAPRVADEIFWNPGKGELDEKRIEGVDAVIHLAGENVAAGRWTQKRRHSIMSSRVEGTRTLVSALGRMKRRPEVLLSAAATGIYGFKEKPNAAPATETTPTGEGFLAEVCIAWEKEVRQAEALNIRTVIMRIGVVQTPAGGALAKMLPLFKAGLGGRIGSGRQGFSWISMDDLLRAIYFLMTERRCAGAYNLVGPEAASNSDFARTLARVLDRPAIFPVPAMALRGLFGEMADEALLGGVRTAPERLLDAGFLFAHPTLESALRFELGRGE